MVHTEIQIKNKRKYYYRTLTVRDKDKFRKIRKYLGKELTKKQLIKKEKEANSYINLELKKFKKIKIGERNLYKQSGAGITITIGLPFYPIAEPVTIDNDLVIFYKGDMLYSTPDLQFLHYFLAEEIVPTIDEILSRMEKNPNWIKQRINEFNKAVKGFERIGENLIEGGESFSEKDNTKALNAYEKFLNKDYSYWVPSIFIDMFDIFEEKMIEFVFKDKKESLIKEDMQFLFLPDKSVFWKEKNDFENIRKEIKKKKLGKTNKLLWKLLKDHAKKYWWINNDYQVVKKLGASYFYQRLDETSEKPFWKTVAKKKKELIKKYSLDKATVERLKQISEMVYLRDVRKKYTQIASYYISEFYHIVAKKMNIPLEWSDFVIPFSEYKKFLNKDKKFLKELEMRVKKGVWMLGGDLDWKSRTETLKAKELLALVEGNLKGRKIVYGNIASLGKGIGTAKIVLRQSEFGKFNEGDVLITGMTRPEFVPLMKMASAIVTDEGGITCHAAIISRELSKPCIIGTQTATRTFKDGDLVEVNANHGFIKNLNS